MAGTAVPGDRGPARQPDSPADVPADRAAALGRLDVLIGEWEIEASFEAGYFGPGTPAITGRSGRTSFEWLDGGFFVIQRFVSEHPAAPSGLAVIGMGAGPETFRQHYFDSRGVARVYQMRLDGNVWKLSREAPGFWQRYRGVISDDGITIAGAWEASADGRDWKHDFGLGYLRVR
jgi:hypothetical protein